MPRKNPFSHPTRWGCSHRNSTQFETSLRSNKETRARGERKLFSITIIAAHFSSSPTRRKKTLCERGIGSWWMPRGENDKDKWRQGLQTEMNVITMLKSYIHLVFYSTVYKRSVLGAICHSRQRSTEWFVEGGRMGSDGSRSTAGSFNSFPFSFALFIFFYIRYYGEEWIAMCVCVQLILFLAELTR